MSLSVEQIERVLEAHTLVRADAWNVECSCGASLAHDGMKTPLDMGVRFAAHRAHVAAALKAAMDAEE